MNMVRELVRVFDYFAIFNYAPSLKQLHAFYGSRLRQTVLRHIIDGLVVNGSLLRAKVGGEWVYSRARDHKFLSSRYTRYKYSLTKLTKASKVIYILSKLPQVELIGVTGSVSVYNAGKNDDIDLFIIARAGQMWACRLLVLFVLQVMGVRRHRGDKKVADKFCCNLFFDERDILVPKERQNYYTAHEVLQMIPLVSKKSMYEKFVEKNRWVFSYFPNARSLILSKTRNNPNNLDYNKDLSIRILAQIAKVLSWLCSFSLFERIIRIVQLTLINRHKTNELITGLQLWFFPRDRSTMRGLKSFDK